MFILKGYMIAIGHSGNGCHRPSSLVIPIVDIVESRHTAILSGWEDLSMVVALHKKLL